MQITELLIKIRNTSDPLAVIPELDLEIYSRCIVCRMTRSGDFKSLQ